jgi:hypothetical protein
MQFRFDLKIKPLYFSLFYQWTPAKVRKRNNLSVDISNFTLLSPVSSPMRFMRKSIKLDEAHYTCSSQL